MRDRDREGRPTDRDRETQKDRVRGRETGRDTVRDKQRETETGRDKK